VNRFLARHHDVTADGKVYPQENPRLKVPREFIDRYAAIIWDEIMGLNPILSLTETKWALLIRRNASRSTPLFSQRMVTGGFFFRLNEESNIEQWRHAFTQHVTLFVLSLRQRAA
jgi:hypothetical protein